MRILYDHQAFTMQEYGGISRYFFELTREFQANPETTTSNSLLFSNNEYIYENRMIPSTAFFRSISSHKKTQIMLLLNEIKSKAAYKRDAFDLFHPTYYDPYYLTVKSDKPVVITFHDLIHEKFKQYDHQTLANKKSVLKRADKIIAISKNSKNDLIEYYKIPEEKIDVIHLASSFGSQEHLNKAVAEPDERYLLYVGSRDHYKNFLFFVKAIAPLLMKHTNLFLYCTGGGAFNKEEKALFKQLRIDHKIKQYSGADESLKRFYSNAVAFFFPSVYEGFGIPLLEAMNCGCPIGASNTSSLPEVAGDAALYFDPYSKDSILSVAEILVNTSGIRSLLQHKGFVRAKEFSWQKTAMKTHNVYKSLL